MTFLNPLLLFGLAGVAVPIAIHLLNRFRPRNVEWAAMDLLRRALLSRSRQIRIEDLLLLLLRCLAILLLAAAMARPTLTGSGASWFIGKPRTGVVIALDGSYSMNHRPGVNTRFDRAAQQIREIVRTLDPGSPTSLVLMGSHPRILLRNVGYDAKVFEDILKETEPFPERLNVELCLEEVDKLVAEIKTAAKECYVVTDAQAMSWRHMSEKARQSLVQIGGGCRLSFVPTGGTGAENAALTDFRHVSGILRRGSMARYLAEVRNQGVRPLQGVTVELTLDDRPVDRNVIDLLGPGQAATVPLFARFQGGGIARLVARLKPDGLTTDNRRYAVAHIRDRVRVLMVDGEPSATPFAGETDYLRTALAPGAARGGPAPMTVKTVPWVDLPLQRLTDYDIVIAANVPDFRESQVAALEAFVRQGGGLFLFLGDNANPRILNARLGSLLPVELGAPAGRAEERAQGWPLEAADSFHPLARIVAALPKELAADARVFRLLGGRLVPGAQTVWRTAGDAQPVLAERRLGAGKVLLFTSTADRAWSDLAIHPLFPMLTHQAATYLTRQPHEAPFTVGSMMVLPIPRRTSQANVIFADPDGKRTPVQTAERENGAVAEYGPLGKPGFYEITYAHGSEPLVAAVNVDPAESAIAALDTAEINALFRELPVRVLTEEVDLASAVKRGRIGRELWRLTMLLGLAILVAEGWLARRFTRRMATAPQPLSKGRFSRREAAEGMVDG